MNENESKQRGGPADPDAAEEPQMLPPVAIRSFSEPRARKPHGPQAWAVVLTIGGLYYVWTKILGKSYPTFGRQGQRIGAGSGIKKPSRDHQAERLAAIERRQQLQRLGNAQKRPNVSTSSVSSGNNPNKLTILQQQQLMKQQQEEAEKRRKVEEKKRKQRQLYLQKKKEADAEEDRRRKDEELGPGWEYRENPSAASASVNAMDPQTGSGGGGYKPTKCKPSRGG